MDQTTETSKKKPTLLNILLFIIFLPFYLLFSKQTRKVTWIIVFIILAIIFVPKFLGNQGENKAETSTEPQSNIQSDAEDTAKITKKLLAYFDDENYESAEKLMQRNSWYRITDTAQESDILNRIENSKYLEWYWLSVLDRIQCNDPDIIEKKDDLLFTAGLKRGKRDIELSLEVWSKCSADSVGYKAHAGFSRILEGDLIGGAEIINEFSRENQDMADSFQQSYTQTVGSEYTTLQQYLDYMIAMALVNGVSSASSLETLEPVYFMQLPNAYLYNETIKSTYEEIFLNDQLRAALPEALKNCSGNKVLVIDKVLLCGTDETEVVINPFVTESLPKEYRPRAWEDIGYVLLMDYGYEADGIWYAGTATAKLYDLKTGEEIFVSETKTGIFKTSYYGKQTNLIFGTYPETTEIIKEALASINNNTPKARN